ncbi:UPF0481 protein At3g47200-like [Magnolia sinica]|uniref:UPF0481 protein At3g47200-like n=1 Tax=Magnolia sinica TaxID=86752 RepID=UPI0026597A2A|nr:UPF0481 protein At3g47200-like [Magnolia sinica]
MRNVQRQRRTKISVSRIAEPIAASFKMPEIEEGANTSTNASPRPSCLTPDRQALADSIMESVKASVSKLRRGDPPTIYIVRQTIRQVNEVAYEPKMVSIGPYHHGKERLQGMEENKLLYLDSFLSRNPDHLLEDYLEAIEELKDKARSCYSEKVGPLMGKEFLKMVVLDACFIVEFFLRFLPFMYKLELCRQLWEELKQNEDLGLISAMDKFFFHSNGFEDPIFRTIGMDSLIGYDMLLLENQIPFFLLQNIFKMACPVNVPHLLEKMALYFFDEFMPRNKKIEIKDSYYHLLHLFHSHLIPTPTDHGKEEHNLLCNPIIKYVLNKLKNLLMFLPCSNKAPLPITKPLQMIPFATDLQLVGVKFKKNEKSNTIKYVLNKLKNLLMFLPCSKKKKEKRKKLLQMIPCATDLQLAGVKFKKNEESNSILKVKFSHGVLEIPLLLIHDHSDTLFRNLVAFEQCHPEATICFTTYLMFMDFLVNTSKDVALLHRNGIIDNLLGSDDEVAHLFNRLCIGIFHNFEGSYLSDVKDRVQKHCENKRNMWRASLMRDYFSNPWTIISLIAAFILLGLTITQTVFSILH